MAGGYCQVCWDGETRVAAEPRLEVQGVSCEVNGDVMLSHPWDSQDQFIGAQGHDKDRKFFQLIADALGYVDKVGNVSAGDGSAVDHIYCTRDP